MVAAVGHKNRLAEGRVIPLMNTESRDVPSLRKTTQNQVRKAQRTEKLGLQSGPRKGLDIKRTLARAAKDSFGKLARQNEQRRRARTQEDLYERARAAGVNVDERQEQERAPEASLARKPYPYVATQRYGSLPLTLKAAEQVDEWRYKRQAELDARAAALEARAPAPVKTKSTHAD